AARERVDDARADAVQAAGGGVGATAELPACVELGVDDLDAGEAGAGLDVHRNTAASVAHLDGVVGVEDHRDRLAVSAERLVDGVVEDLPEAVHEAPGVGGADVHAGTLAHGLEALEDLEVAGVVGGLLRGGGGGHPPDPTTNDAANSASSARGARRRGPAHRALRPWRTRAVDAPVGARVGATKDPMNLTLEAPRLTAHDRCDRCGAQAYVKVLLEAGGELMFCAHQARAHQA